MKKLPLSLAIGALLISPLSMAKTVNAVASFTVLADIVKQVGGEHVNVKSLVGPNGDPHTFEPTPQDSQALAKADIVFVSGLGLEGWMDRLVSASGYKGEPVVASRGVSTRSAVWRKRAKPSPTRMHGTACITALSTPPT